MDTWLLALVKTWATGFKRDTKVQTLFAGLPRASLGTQEGEKSFRGLEDDLDSDVLFHHNVDFKTSKQSEWKGIGEANHPQYGFLSLGSACRLEQKWSNLRVVVSPCDSARRSVYISPKIPMIWHGNLCLDSIDIHSGLPPPKRNLGRQSHSSGLGKSAQPPSASGHLHRRSWRRPWAWRQRGCRRRCCGRAVLRGSH